MSPLTPSPASDVGAGDAGYDVNPAAPNAQQREEAARISRLDGIAERLSREAIARVGRRQPVEQRWLEDLRQYNGLYDDATIQRIKDNAGSEVFVNITRPKTKAAESRLGDMLFPTDDRNWAVSPTPVPTLKTDLRNQSPAMMQVQKDSLLPWGQPTTEQQPVTDPNGQPMTVSQVAQQELELAKQRAEGMTAEIDDQLTEAQYSSKCRMVIHDACVLGTGVLKAPSVIGRTRRSWKKVTGPGGQVMQVLEVVTDPRPGAERVNPWNFFPDDSVACIDDCRDVQERRYETRRDMEKLAQDPYYIGQNVLKVLRLGPKQSQITRNPISDQREQASNTGELDSLPTVESDEYEVWEYHGPLTVEDLRCAGVDVTGMEDTDEAQGCIVYCGGIVIKAYLNPMETGDGIYSVFNYEKDESSIYGYGVPYRLRNAQKVLNAAWRGLMDNAALSVGPQIVVNKGLIEPEDGDYLLKGRKTWTLTDKSRRVQDAFGVFNIDSHQNELQAIIEIAQKFADDETFSQIAQGEQGAHTTQTLGGMSILMNAANVVTRATVKNFDDGITTPVIRRFYDWNMQNSPREDIKGDFEVDARGSSVLLSKEIQAQNLMALASNFAGHPIFGMMTKHAALYRKVVQAMHISADDVVKSDEEIDAIQKSQAGQPPPDPRLAVEQSRQQFEIAQLKDKHQNDMSMAAAEHDARMQELDLERERMLLQLASKERITLDQLKKDLVLGSIKSNSFNKELALKQQTGSGI